MVDKTFMITPFIIRNTQIPTKIVLHFTEEILQDQLLEENKLSENFESSFVFWIAITVLSQNAPA